MMHRNKEVNGIIDKLSFKSDKALIHDGEKADNGRSIHTDQGVGGVGTVSRGHNCSLIQHC